MGDILKEAIADAKAVRETALENAKMALEEAFTPQIKSMLSAKLKEDEMGDEEEPVHGEDEEAGEEEEVPAEEAYYEGEHEDEEEPEEGYREDEEVGEEEPEEGYREDDEPGEEDKLDLEAIIRELEDELGKDEEPVEEQDDAYSDAGDKSDKNDGIKSSDLAEGEHEDDDDDTVEEEYEIQLEGDDDDDDDETVDEVDKSSGVGTSDNSVADTDKSSGIGTGENSLKEQLKEYKEAVKFLKDKLHEVNILNAKLLFTNKLFKSYSLDNNQKLKVVETFDRAQTTREIKLVYSTLAEQFNDNGSIVTRKSIKESASSAVGSTRPSKGSRKVISEETQVANRFKKLAGLIK